MVDTGNASLNLAAFLATIRHSEGTDQYPDPWRVCFAGEDADGKRKPPHIISDLSNHPVLTGEWAGESLDFLGPEYKGLISTAAGAYQIIRPTWVSIQVVLRLPDFGQASQDKSAAMLIKQCGAFWLVNSGRIGEAIPLCARIWASLPGSRSKQPQKNIGDLLAFYGSAGGAYA